MDKLIQKVIALFKAKNVELTAEDVISLAGTETQPTMPDFSAKHNAEQFEKMKEYFQTELQKTEQKWKDQLTVMTEEKKQLEKLLLDEKTARESAQKAIEDKAATEKQAKIAQVIEDLKKHPSFPSANEELLKSYQNALETNFDVTMKIIESLPKVETPNLPTTPQTQSVTQPKIGLGSGVSQEILDYAYGKTQTLK